MFKQHKLQGMLPIQTTSQPSSNSAIMYSLLGTVYHSHSCLPWYLTVMSDFNISGSPAINTKRKDGWSLDNPSQPTVFSWQDVLEALTDLAPRGYAGKGS